MAQQHAQPRSEYEAELYDDLLEGATRTRRRRGIEARTTFTIPPGLNAKFTAYGDFVRSNASFVKFLEVHKKTGRCVSTPAPPPPPPLPPPPATAPTCPFAAPRVVPVWG